MKIRPVQLLYLVMFSFCPALVSAQINGFTEPFRQIELASDETGSISEMTVDEGQSIGKGEVLAKLDDRVQQLQVESARHLANSRSAMNAARRTLDKRQVIASRIEQLISTGHATDSEMIRADLEQSIAQARYMASEEESVGREIDLRRAELMLERRLIRSPFDAVVSKVHRKEGEFLSPLRPEVVTLIQIDRLLAVFNIPSHEVDALRNRSKIRVAFNEGNEVVGQIHSVGVQTDAESGTVQVKIRLENSEGKLRSGEQCFLEL